MAKPEGSLKNSILDSLLSLKRNLLTPFDGISHHIHGGIRVGPIGRNLKLLPATRIEQPGFLGAQPGCIFWFNDYGLRKRMQKHRLANR